MAMEKRITEIPERLLKCVHSIQENQVKLLGARMLREILVGGNFE
jgi:hypothetical protein